ncbi:MAG: hypothetical protein AAF945_14270 [Actinomycetota bacterium]
MAFTDTLTDRFETAGRTAVENATDANTRIVDTVVDWNEKAVDATVKFADRVEAPFAVPFADQLPTAQEAGKRYMEFVQRAADVNREVQNRVVELLPAAYQPVAATTAK